MRAVCLYVDNTNTMTGVYNSVELKFKAKNGNIFISRCPCHLAHITATHANDLFSNVVGFTVESLCINLFYLFL